MAEAYPILSMDGFETEEQKEQRFLNAKKEAKKAANALKQRFGISEVFLFGSLLNVDKFAAHSDIDLAVEGMPVDDFYKAHSMLMDMIDGFEFDLVEIESCKPEVLESIRRTGVML